MVLGVVVRPTVVTANPCLPCCPVQLSLFSELALLNKLNDDDDDDNLP